MEKNVIRNMRTIISPGRSVQFVHIELVKNPERAKRRRIVHTGRAEECFYGYVSFIYGHDIGGPVYLNQPCAGKSRLGINTAWRKGIILSVDSPVSCRHSPCFWIHVIEISVVNQPSGFHDAGAFKEIPFVFDFFPSGGDDAVSVHIVFVRAPRLPPGQEHASAVEQITFAINTLKADQTGAFELS